jgi:hypothetical protein
MDYCAIELNMNIMLDLELVGGCTVTPEEEYRGQSVPGL